MKTNIYKIAVIDVGSNSVRLMLLNNTTKQKYTITTRLGEGLSFSDKLLKSAIDRTVEAVSVFYKKALENNVKEIYCFATAAVRNSSNGQEFVDLVKKTLNLDVDVVSGEEEASLALQGALNGQDGGVLDVGGASSEICVQQDGKLVYGYSLKTGAVKIYDKFGRDFKKIKEFLTSEVKKYGSIPKLNFKAVGGTVTTLAAIDLKLKNYSDELVDGHYLKIERIREITNELFLLSPSEISKKYSVNDKRSEIIAGGSLIILTVLEYANLSGITVSASDNLEGYVFRRIYEKN